MTNFIPSAVLRHQPGERPPSFATTSTTQPFAIAATQWELLTPGGLRYHCHWAEGAAALQCRPGGYCIIADSRGSLCCCHWLIVLCIPAARLRVFCAVVFIRRCLDVSETVAPDGTMSIALHHTMSSC